MNLFWVLLALSCYFASAAVFATERVGVANRWRNEAALLLGAGALLQLIEFATVRFRLAICRLLISPSPYRSWPGLQPSSAWS